MSASRYALTCSLCKQHHGAVIQCCAGSKCHAAFHPLCARFAGLPMLELQASDKGMLAELKENVRKCTGSRQYSLERESTMLAEGVHLVAFCSRHAACAPGRQRARTDKPTLSLSGAPAQHAVSPLQGKSFFIHATLSLWYVIRHKLAQTDDTWLMGQVWQYRHGWFCESVAY